MKNRIYVCHTFYHVYVTFLKELNLPKEERGNATLVISHMTNPFGDFSERIRALNFFEEVVDFDEKNVDFFPELANYKKEGKNIICNFWQRIRYTKRLGKLEAAYVPVDFKKYKEIYVFCDSDPIGYYLNYKRIRYHAVEDGLNCLKHGDLAHYDNRDHFALKAFMSQKLNLIFIQNGYGKYCIDMEVNDISAIDIPFEKYKEVSRRKLVEGLSKEDKQFLLKAFVRDFDKLNDIVTNSSKKTALILTEPLCTLDIRKKIFEDIIAMYDKDYSIILKPHPRDEMDYNAEFPTACIIEKSVPMEMLNFFDGYKIDLAVGVFTEMSGIDFAIEKHRLGPDFMDKYEDPMVHRQSEIVKKAFSK